MRHYKYLIIATAICIFSSFSHGEIHFGDISGIESSDEEQSLRSARDVLSSVAKEQKFIWIQPLGTKIEETKDGKKISTIIYKAATATPSKYTIEEQVELQKEFEKKHGIASSVSGRMSPTTQGPQGILELLQNDK